MRGTTACRLRWTTGPGEPVRTVRGGLEAILVEDGEEPRVVVGQGGILLLVQVPTDELQPLRGLEEATARLASRVVVSILGEVGRRRRPLAAAAAAAAAAARRPWPPRFGCGLEAVSRRQRRGLGVQTR